MTPPDHLLIIVDPQNDFVDGSLAVPGAAKALGDLARFIAEGKARDYAHVIITLDSHPATHCSFKANGGIWPQHCVAGSQGAAIWLPLKEALEKSGTPYTALTKGTNQAREEYSIFGNELSRKHIIDLAKKYDANGADICGVAGDYCVKETFIDAAAVFGTDHVEVLTRFTASTDGGSTLNDILNTSRLCAR